ncbi:MAG TPA: hypothetical protein VGM60_10180 [Pseudonocardia sp.]|uniref:hypothetical protein n=1 Tax=Pseudonocardia sp. TaxID=60912 RepID=UPI002F412608
MLDLGAAEKSGVAGSSDRVDLAVELVDALAGKDHSAESADATSAEHSRDTSLGGVSEGRDDGRGARNATGRAAKSTARHAINPVGRHANGAAPTGRGTDRHTDPASPNADGTDPAAKEAPGTGHAGNGTGPKGAPGRPDGAAQTASPTAARMAGRAAAGQGLSRAATPASRAAEQHTVGGVGNGVSHTAGPVARAGATGGSQGNGAADGVARGDRQRPAPGAGEIEPTRRAAAEIRRRVNAGEPPVGLSRLSEVLSPSSGAPPAPRQPVDEEGALVEVVRRHPCGLLDAADASAVAAGLAAVLADGRRVLVTGTDQDQLAKVRTELPAPLSGLCLDGPLRLTDAELRELRWLQATSTPRRRQRHGQTLPDPELVPDVERVAALCRAAGGKGFPAREGADLIPELLGDLPAEQLQTLVSAATGCNKAIDALDAGHRDTSWARPLLERVLFGSATRSGFDRLLRRTADIVVAAERLADAADKMAVIGELPPDAADQLHHYANFLESGGKTRVYFRSPQQRAVEPTLRHLQLDGVAMRDPGLLRQAASFIELIRSMKDTAAACEALDVPVPADVPEVAALNRSLSRIEEAVRATEHLRHEVLFIHPTSPVAMPDLDSTQSVARTVLASGGQEKMTKARDELHELGEALEGTLGGLSSIQTAAPEFGQLIEALHGMNLPAYQEALGELAGARRQHADQQRLTELLARLRACAPGLAKMWEERGGQAFAYGTARFVPLDELLAALPEADTADLVLLLGAGSLSASNLLVAAAAPRLLAVDTGFARQSAPPGTPRPLAALGGSDDTVLTVLRRAAVPIVLAGGRSVTPAAASAPAAAAGARTASPASAGAVPAQRDPVGAPSAQQGPVAAPLAQPVPVAAPPARPGPAAAVPAQRGPTDAPAARGGRARPATPSATPSAAPAGPDDKPERKSGRVPDDELAFMVMPLGIVPRQVDRTAAPETAEQDQPDT